MEIFWTTPQNINVGHMWVEFEGALSAGAAKWVEDLLFIDTEHH